tara:strand:- start:155 stop:1036 length:882 start_codon:yes stop_codon:yes gene_type:complete
MAKLPYFKFYPSDFMGSGKVAMMSPCEVGIYIKLLCVCWQEGSLPDDPVRLGRLTGATVEEMQSAWPSVRDCFEVHQGRLTHSRLEKERDAAANRSTKAKRAAAARYASSTAPSNAPSTAGSTAQGGAQTLPYSEAHSSEAQKTEDKKTTGADAPNKVVTYTKGELLAEAESVLGLGKLNNTDKLANARILNSWLYSGESRTAEDVYAAIHGAAMMRDKDLIGWDSAAPGIPMTLKALNGAMTLTYLGDGKVQQTLWFAAIDHFRKHDPLNRPSKARGTTIASIGELIGQVSA